MNAVQSSLLSVPAFFWLTISPVSGGGSQLTSEPVLNPPDLAVVFQEATSRAGIHFRHVNGATPEKYVPETIGAGGLFFDYNNDGWLDVFLVDSGSLIDEELSGRARCTLYRNSGDGSFTDVTVRSGIKNGAYGIGACAADYDNDGWVDLYITNFGPNILYRNNRDGTFKDVSDHAQVGSSLWSTSCALGDVDRDGDLDLYVANYIDFTVENNKFCGDHVRGIRGYCHPNVYNGLPDILYRNNADGTFSEITKEAGISSQKGNGLGVVIGDYDNDGWPDIYVANDAVPNFLYRNQGNGSFQEVGLSAGVAVSGDGQAEAGMGTDLGDFDNDGLLDLVVTNLHVETNTLYRNLGQGIFEDVTTPAGLGEASLGLVGFGTDFLDYDNDGDLDLIVANGNVGHPMASGISVAYAQRNLLFQNQGGGRFLEVGLSSGPGFELIKISRGLASGDIDNDGDLDVLVTNNGQGADLLRNEGGHRNHSLLVRTIGQESNRDGVGTRLKLRVGTKTQSREVQAGSSYLGQNDMRVHFGLGQADRIDRLELLWPSGKVEVFENLKPNQILIILEGSGIIRRERLKTTSQE